MVVILILTARLPARIIFNHLLTSLILPDYSMVVQKKNGYGSWKSVAIQDLPQSDKAFTTPL
jgi:hypothetical protein